MVRARVHGTNLATREPVSSLLRISCEAVKLELAALDRFP
jgi:hypothetical protein